MLDLLRAGPMTTGQVCSHFETSRFAVMKHLKELQKAGMVIVERRGRERINHLNPVSLQMMHQRWIRPFEQLPADRLLQIKRIAERATEQKP